MLAFQTDQAAASTCYRHALDVIVSPYITSINGLRHLLWACNFRSNTVNTQDRIKNILSRTWAGIKEGNWSSNGFRSLGSSTQFISSCHSFHGSFLEVLGLLFGWECSVRSCCFIQKSSWSKAQLQQSKINWVNGASRKHAKLENEIDDRMEGVFSSLCWRLLVPKVHTVVTVSNARRWITLCFNRNEFINKIFLGASFLPRRGFVFRWREITTKKRLKYKLKILNAMYNRQWRDWICQELIKCNLRRYAQTGPRDGQNGITVILAQFSSSPLYFGNSPPRIARRTQVVTF